MHNGKTVLTQLTLKQPIYFVDEHITDIYYSSTGNFYFETLNKMPIFKSKSEIDLAKRKSMIPRLRYTR